jgi:hypothetical protein
MARVERVSPSVRHIDIVHRDPEKSGGFLLHQALRDIDRELIPARET